MELFPTNISQVDDRTLGIHWNDGVDSTYDVFKLRCMCPCANCVDEMTGERTLDPSKIAADVRPVDIVQVGNYALKIAWSDNHDTGIYTWIRLRVMAEESD